jgi:predicted RNA-binding protein YlxR (DUF448 family)/ribosomal protein L30E
MTEPDDAEETGPERTCFLTRRKGPVDGMIRFVRAPDRSVVPDLKRNLPGRGVWLTLSHAVVEESVRKKLFSKAFRKESHADPALADLVERLMLKSALDALSLAIKAGQVVSGFAKVEEAVMTGNCHAVIEAADAAEDGLRKMGQVLRRAAEMGQSPKRAISPFSSDDLGLALGRDHVIHAALLMGSAARAAMEKIERVMLYRSGDRTEPEA